ncbi:MAG: hypothetical protein IKV23_01950 [Bacteroidaceae bacterium]|nr:hypothetical protein [Bacteroidaceae bacterium]
MKNLVKKAEKREFWSAAKRLMIVGIMVIGFIMPAQVSAQNANRGEKGRQEMVQKKNDKKENKKNYKKADKKADKKKDFNKKGNNAANKNNKGHKPNVVVVEHHHHNKPVVVHHNKPVVVHHHDNVVHHHCNGVAEAATAVIGLAALIALIAN